MIYAKDLAHYALQAVGGGYLWGSDGQKSTLKFRQELAQRAPAQAGNLLGVCAKWDGRACWDCSGLFRGAWRKLLAYKSGGATTIFKTWCTESGAIGTMPDEPGIAVFRGTPASMSHIGMYIGDGTVVDARGSSAGVVRGPITGYAWTHWGRLKDVTDGGDHPAAAGTAPAPEPETQPPYQAEVVNVKIGLNLRTSPVNAVNTILLIPPHGVVDVLRDDCGNGFAHVRYYGTLGYCTRSYLSRLETEDEPEDNG